MTELLFGAAGFMTMGYLIGKLFIRLNPFSILLGAFVLFFAVAPVMLQLDNRNFATVFFILGAILNFKRPISSVMDYISGVFGTLKLRKLNESYINDLHTQKAQVEQELHEQKRQFEEDIRRQKAQAEEQLRRQEEDLKRKQEQFDRKQRQKNQGSSYQQSQRADSPSEKDKWHLNPLVFEEACEILGLSAGKTLLEYKRAYKALVSKYHADKLSGLSEALKKQEEEKIKILNVAMTTIKKKLR